MPCGPGGLGHARRLNLRRPHPAPCRLPRAVPAPSRAGWSLQTIPSAKGNVLRRAQRTMRKMLLSDFCNRPNVTSTPRMIRFPSLPRHGPCGPRVDWDPSTALAAVGTTRVELRLTAILQLRRRSRPSWAEVEGLASALARRWRRPVLAGAAIDSPSERRRPAAVFSTAGRARHLTSDALCRAPRLPGRSPSSAGCQTRFRRRLVKAGGFFEPERLPSTSAPLRGPATVLTALPPRAGFRRRFAPRTTGGFPPGTTS